MISPADAKKINAAYEYNVKMWRQRKRKVGQRTRSHGVHLLDGLLTSASRALGWGRGSAVQGDPGHDHGKLAAQAQGPDGTVRPHAAAASLAPQVPDPSERGPVFVQEAIGIETDENAGVQLPAS